MYYLESRIWFRNNTRNKVPMSSSWRNYKKLKLTEINGELWQKETRGERWFCLTVWLALKQMWVTILTSVVKGIRIHHHKTCHFDIRITLAIRQLKITKYRKGSLPSPISLKVEHKFSIVKAFSPPSHQMEEKQSLSLGTENWHQDGSG